ncbi:kinase-like domain-containing protein [Polychytrium aggregatum]|uniref:kinase-like domain-containing protein n=1 Tax=Polychytrium aggregatum TaxID=110093 RepID=UPI0022FDE970|nr:kinase-like domain-containing protein [Polychytrium aggregatum]KAI9205519.1 kinase-like domain-containing protein [Polychytrium aggregatum]
MLPRAAEQVPWFIPADAITDLSQDPIARGGFGEVFRGSYFGSDVAVKRLLGGFNGGELQEFQREIGVWYGLSHPHIIPLLGACHTADRPFMVSPFMENGTLRSYLTDNAGRLEVEEKLRLMYQVASGMTFLHQRSIVHGDLKTLNVLLDKGYNAVISDFGMSRTKHTSSSMIRLQPGESAGGTIDYIAPEMLDEDEPAGSSKKTDVYAFGITLYEVMNDCECVWVSADGQPLRPRAIESLICRGARPKKLDSIPPQIRDLIQSCWHQEPRERPKFEEILRQLTPYRINARPVDRDGGRASERSRGSRETRNFSTRPRRDRDEDPSVISVRPRPDGNSNWSVVDPNLDLARPPKQIADELDAIPGISRQVRQRAKRGDPDSCLQIANTITADTPGADPTWDTAAVLIQVAADNEHIDAFFPLGWLYLAGVGFGQNDTDAITYWRDFETRSVDVGLKSITTLMLGWLTYLGRGTAKDKQKGINLIRQSKTADFPLGEACMNTRAPASSNSAVATKYFEMCKLGSERDWLCRHLMAMCYLGGFGTTKNQPLAIDILTELAQQGHDVSQHCLGRCYGIGLEFLAEDKAKLLEWCTKAADQDNSYAQNMMGRIYTEGWTVAKDLAKAAEWYRKASDQGCSTAQFNLANCYERGMGVAKDIPTAINLYRLAADQGESDAADKISQLTRRGIIR